MGYNAIGSMYKGYALGQGIGKGIGEGITSYKAAKTAKEVDNAGEQLHNILTADKNAALQEDVNKEADFYKNAGSDAVAIDENGNPILDLENETFKRVTGGGTLKQKTGMNGQPETYVEYKNSLYSNGIPDTSTTEDVTNNYAENPANTPYKNAFSIHNYYPVDITDKNGKVWRQAGPEDIVDLDKYKAVKYQEYYKNAPLSVLPLLPKPDEVYKDGKFNSVEVEKSLGKLAVLHNALSGGDLGKATMKQNAFKNLYGEGNDLDTEIKKAKLVDLKNKSNANSLDNQLKKAKIEQYKKGTTKVTTYRQKVNDAFTYIRGAVKDTSYMGAPVSRGYLANEPIIEQWISNKLKYGNKEGKALASELLTKLETAGIWNSLDKDKKYIKLTKSDLDYIYKYGKAPKGLKKEVSTTSKQNVIVHSAKYYLQFKNAKDCKKHNGAWSIFANKCLKP